MIPCRCANKQTFFSLPEAKLCLVHRPTWHDSYQLVHFVSTCLLSFTWILRIVLPLTAFHSIILYFTCCKVVCVSNSAHSEEQMIWSCEFGIQNITIVSVCFFFNVFSRCITNSVSLLIIVLVVWMFSVWFEPTSCFSRTVC